MTPRVPIVLRHIAVSIALVVLGGCDSAAEPASDPLTSAILPAGPTADEMALKGDEADPRDSLPAYAYTDAPNDVLRLPGEFEPVAELLLAYMGDLSTVYVDVIRATAAEAPVTVLFRDDKHATRLRDALAAAGVDAAHVTFDKVPFDSVWIRDWGPQVVTTLDGGQRMIDTRYYKGRDEDDVFPTRLALERGLRSSRPAVATEGGNLLSDGAGSCIIGSTVGTRNATSLARLEQLYLENYGCERLIELYALEGEPTGHVDIYVTITGPREAIVGKYAFEVDRENLILQNIAALDLERAGFKVRRIPMPDNDRRARFRTYTNAVAVNGVVLVPVYPDAKSGEAAALAVFAAAYPDRKIVPIDASSAIESQGAIHCLTATIPKRGEVVAEPDAGGCVGVAFGEACKDGYCDGQGRCVPGPVPTCPCFAATEVDVIGRHEVYPHGVASCAIAEAATSELAQRTVISDNGTCTRAPPEMATAGVLHYPDRTPEERFVCYYHVASSTPCERLEERQEVVTEGEYLACRSLVEARIDELGCTTP